MSNLKITDLSSLSQSALDASADFLLAVDVSDTTMSATGYLILYDATGTAYRVPAVLN